MPGWLAQIVIMLMTKLTSWLFAKGLEVVNAKKLQISNNADIDDRLLAFKNAYKEAFNGQPVTPEQRAKLKQSISDFIRDGSNGGL